MITIKVPDEILEEVQQQLTADQDCDGFNHDMIVLEMLKETFELVTGELELI